MDFIPDQDGGAGGVIEIHVDDAGEGMNEQIIDDQLTTLFSSSKENDQTKIGKFGIGFVSVFAPGPRAVLVQTGRGGEYWEVLFDQDRSFSKARIDTPIEGTQITLFLAGDRARYTELVARSLETIDRWCRHSEAEINFEDRASSAGARVAINKPFSVDGACMTTYERDGTEIVLAYSHAPVWGFYNKGLALAVVSGQTDLVPAELGHIAFRIKSRYLEHTLSRETVMRDENYDKAMAMVIEAARGPLLRSLVADIAALVTTATQRRWTARERARYFELMGYLARERPAALAEFGEQPLLLGFDDKAYTLAQLYRCAAADGRVYVEVERTPLVEQLLAQGTPVVVIPSASELNVSGAAQLGPVTRVLTAAFAREYLEHESVTRMVEKLRGKAESNAWAHASELITRPIDVLVGVEPITDMPNATALVQAADSVLTRGLPPPPGFLRRALGFLRRREDQLGYARLVCARLHGGATAAAPLFVIAHEVAPLMAIPTQEGLLGDRPEQPEVAVNCEHPHFRALLRLADSQPALAAYCLAKSLLLADARALERDHQLMLAAIDPAWGAQ
jgi:hypothetical protein